MTQNSNDHAWFQEQIAIALTGGLPAAEQERFDAHAADCADCAAALADAADADAAVKTALAGLRPRAGLEDRIIAGLRQPRGRWAPRLAAEHPMLRRAAAAVAAAILLAGFGYGGTKIAGSQSSSMFAEAPGWDWFNGPKSAASKHGNKATASSRPASRMSVSDLIRQARSEINQTHYSAALGYLDQVEALDPNNDYARGVRQFVEDRAILQDQRNGRDHSAAQYFESIGTEKIPYDDILRYPGNWPDISQMREQEHKESTSAFGRESHLPATSTGKDAAAATTGAMRDAIIVQRESDEKDFPTLSSNPAQNGPGAVVRSKSSDQTPGDPKFMLRENRPTLAARGTNPDSEGYVSEGWSRPGPPVISAGDVFARADIAYTGPDKPFHNEQIAVRDNNDSVLLPTDDDRLPDVKLSVRGVGTGINSNGGLTNDARAGLKDEPTKNGPPVADGSAIKMALSSTPGPTGIVNLANTAPPTVLGTTKTDIQPDIVLKSNDIAPVKAPGDVVADNAVRPQTVVRVDTKNEVAPSSPAPSTRPSLDDRKIVRTGQIEFEIDNFDSAYSRLRDIVKESGGYIGATDSEKLPNGKMRGTVTVRVPPDGLDVLILKLRGLGDLKGQKIAAEDITKEYTDTQSELRAAQAMQERLLEIIRTSKGQVKDLIAAEKELGVWREKIEKMTGEINYYNNLVALSTLQVTLTEKDIRQAAVATETETVNAGLEVEDVPKTRELVLAEIDRAKGRVAQANLRQLEAGQFTSEITASVPPDAAGAVIDRLKQMGRVARLESTRQETSNGQTVVPGVKIERQDTVLVISIYNVAAYAPRITQNLAIGCADVETTYNAVLDFAKKSEGGRVISSSLTRPRPDTSSGVVVFEVKETAADAAMAFLKATGTVLQLTVSENREANNVTTAKRAFAVTLTPLAAIAPQETVEVTILPKAGDLLATYTALLDFAGKPGSAARIVDKTLQQDNGTYTSAAIAMEVSRQTMDAADRAIAAAGKVVSRKATRLPDSANTVDTKVLLKFTFVNVDALAPKETIWRGIAAADVPRSFESILAIARVVGAGSPTSMLSAQDPQNITGEISFDVPAEKRAAVEEVIEKAGAVVSRSVTRAPENDATTESKVRLRLTLQQLDQLRPRRTYVIGVESGRVDAAAADVMSSALAAGGRVVEHATATDDNGQAAATLTLDVPLSKADAVAEAARDKGKIRQDRSTEDPQAPSGDVARARLEISFASEAPVVAEENGLGATLRHGLVTSVRGLLWSLQLLVIGLCLAGPWVLILWLGWRWVRRGRRKAVAV